MHVASTGSLVTCRIFYPASRVGLVIFMVPRPLGSHLLYVSPLGVSLYTTCYVCIYVFINLSSACFVFDFFKPSLSRNNRIDLSSASLLACCLCVCMCFFCLRPVRDPGVRVFLSACSRGKKRLRRCGPVLQSSAGASTRHNTGELHMYDAHILVCPLCKLFFYLTHLFFIFKFLINTCVSPGRFNFSQRFENLEHW